MNVRMLKLLRSTCDVQIFSSLGFPVMGVRTAAMTSGGEYLRSSLVPFAKIFAICP